MFRHGIFNESPSFKLRSRCFLLTKPLGCPKLVTELLPAFSVGATDRRRRAGCEALLRVATGWGVRIEERTALSIFVPFAFSSARKAEHVSDPSPQVSQPAGTMK